MDPTLVYGAFAAGFALAVSVFAFASKWRRASHVAVPAPVAVPEVKPAGPRVLLVDDDPAAGKLMARILEPIGVHVVCVGSAEHARRLLSEEGFAVIIVDLKLPGLSGEDLVYHLRPPVILTSTVHPDELREAAERCGADGFLEKDGNVRTITETVARMLDRVPPPRQSRPSMTG